MHGLSASLEMGVGKIEVAADPSRPRGMFLVIRISDCIVAYNPNFPAGLSLLSLARRT